LRRIWTATTTASDFHDECAYDSYEHCNIYPDG
jgi:hypothetical protein